MSKNRLPAEERRQQIIEKAAEVFCIHGVDGTRTRDIALACGINEALIYRHFDGKDDLYRTAMLYAYDRSVDKWTENAEKQPNGLLAIIAVLRTRLEMLSQNPMLNALMWHGVASTTHDPIIKDMIRERFDRYHAYLRELIEKGIGDGSIREDVDSEKTAWLVRGLTWSFILKVLIDLQVIESAHDPEYFCEILRERISSEF